MGDVVVQCKMLGEGYDNPWIAISVFMHPAKSVSPLSQIHGRAMRMPKPHQIGKERPGRGVSCLFYPDEREARRVVEEYKQGNDESIESLFSPPLFKSIRQAHTDLGRLASDDLVSKLQDRLNFEAYHDLYEERRSNWDPIPAEKLAEDIYDMYLGNEKAEMDVKIVDYGCGRDGLFEHCLAKKVKVRDGSGSVYTLAVDVSEQKWAAGLRSERPEDGIDATHTSFECESIGGNYGDRQTYKDLPGDRRTGFDAAIMCLSFMSSNALSESLIVAAGMLQPTGVMYIVLDTFKFGFSPRTKEAQSRQLLEEWKAKFQRETGFTVRKYEMKKPFVYLQINNVAARDLVEVTSKLSGEGAPTMKSLAVRTNGEPSATPDASLGEIGSPSQSHDDAGSHAVKQGVKRRLDNS